MAAATQVNLDELRAKLSSMLDERRNDDVLAAVIELVSKLTADNRRLAEQLATFMRGRAKGGSERITPEQLLLFLARSGQTPEGQAEGEADAEVEEQDGSEPAGDGAANDGPKDPDDDEKPQRKRKDIRIVGNVERSTQTSEPPEAQRVCPNCGDPKCEIGRKTRTLVEVVPAQFKLVDHERVQYACRTCDDPDIVIGAPAVTPLESGGLTTSLLVDFLARKHVDHEPVNRIAETYARLGIEFPLGTLYGWVEVGADLFEPIAKRIVSNAVAAAVLCVDDTGITVLDDETEKGSRRGHLWTLLGDETWAGFQFTPDWKAEHAEKFLGARQGWLQADAYAGYDRFFGRGGAVEVGCWAHARRYFVKALDVGDARAAKPIDILARLFRVERRADEKGYDDTRRLMLRQEKSRPLLNELGAWVDSVHATAPPDTTLGRAITYLKNQWVALVQFLRDGRLRLTNNAAERQLRHIAIA